MWLATGCFAPSAVLLREVNLFLRSRKHQLAADCFARLQRTLKYVVVSSLAFALSRCSQEWPAQTSASPGRSRSHPTHDDADLSQSLLSRRYVRSVRSRFVHACERLLPKHRRSSQATIKRRIQSVREDSRQSDQRTLRRLLLRFRPTSHRKFSSPPIDTPV